MKTSSARAIRCAIYTRVSTDHGLEQDFNSLDAQREAAEAYVKSQAHEGWRLIKGSVFDDGGFSGGSLERPALQRLLTLIEAGEVDVVVVYKVDRLTRSLADFAKLVELFDAHSTSFVSVTQSFNTTTSMGRLTLNMLLSFAQFEREVTGERIRDKIAASKKRGLWVGGVVPLGYRVEDRRLVVDEAEAVTVRMIFERYLALGSLPALQMELRAAGVVTRRRVLSSGRTIGGVSFTNGPLAHLLRNRTYLGEINHKDRSYPGEHAAIIDPPLFAAVQAKLDDNRNRHRGRYGSSEALLLGRLFDDRGNRMTPSSANKKGVRYRYYVSSVLAQGRKTEAGSVPRVSAPEIEAAVIEALRMQFSDDAHLGDRELITQRLERAVLRLDSIEVDVADDTAPTFSVPWTRQPTNPHREIIRSSQRDDSRPMRAEARIVLIRSIAQGRRWLEEIIAGTADPDAIAAREQRSRRHIEQMVSLAFLAPDLVRAIVDGRLPRGTNASRLMNPPAAWSAQWQMLGLDASR
ncbi:MAG TPA: recombinase family protein [Hyphomicrobiales bacterium]|nr:recombinase family protein [Hyphomicrobiales bacterium]